MSRLTGPLVSTGLHQPVSTGLHHPVSTGLYWSPPTGLYWSLLTRHCWPVSPSLGSRLVQVSNASETSTLTVDPVLQASSSPWQSSAPNQPFSDASKVQSRGPGLSKAFVGQKSSFSVDCSKAGK